MARPPRSMALKPAKAPASLPIGVRAPATMTEPGIANLLDGPSGPSLGSCASYEPGCETGPMRRWVVRVVAARVVLGSLAAAGWFWAVPEYRPSLRAGEDYGIDVSHHQGAIDWGRVAGDDI